VVVVGFRFRFLFEAHLSFPGVPIDF